MEALFFVSPGLSVNHYVKFHHTKPSLPMSCWSVCALHSNTHFCIQPSWSFFFFFFLSTKQKFLDMMWYQLLVYGTLFRSNTQLAVMRCIIYLHSCDYRWPCGLQPNHSCAHIPTTALSLVILTDYKINRFGFKKCLAKLPLGFTYLWLHEKKKRILY